MPVPQGAYLFDDLIIICGDLINLLPLFHRRTTSDLFRGIRGTCCWTLPRRSTITWPTTIARGHGPSLLICSSNGARPTTSRPQRPRLRAAPSPLASNTITTTRRIVTCCPLHPRQEDRDKVTQWPLRVATTMPSSSPTTSTMHPRRLPEELWSLALLGNHI